MKRSEGISEPSRTEMIWAGLICGRCDTPIGDDPAIRVQGVYLGLSYLGTDRWGAETICRTCYGGRASILRDCEYCGRPTGFLAERRHQRFFCSDRCRSRESARRRKESRGH